MKACGKKITLYVDKGRVPKLDELLHEGVIDCPSRALQLGIDILHEHVFGKEGENGPMPEMREQGATDS